MSYAYKIPCLLLSPPSLAKALPGYATNPPYPKVYKASIQHARSIKINRTTSKISEHMTSYIQKLVKEKCIVQ